MTGGSLINGVLNVFVDSSGMLVAALILVIGLEVASAAVRARTLNPVTTWTSTFMRAALNESRSLKVAVPAVDSVQFTVEDAPHNVGSTSPISRLVALGVGAVGAVGIALSGHMPDHGPALLAVVGVLGFSAVLTAHSVKHFLKERFLQRNATRTVASALLADASLTVALVVSLAVVAHTGGLNALSFLEAAAIACCTTLAVRIGPLPRGLVTADIVFVVPLTWIGVPLPVALAAMLIWRLGSFMVLGLAAAVAGVTAPITISRTSERGLGRSFHRATFGFLSVLPTHLSYRIKAIAFDAMFSRSNDPWDYASNTFEARKRGQLLTAVGPHAACILEVGCANGHNLVSLSERFPDSIVIGTDVSHRAMDSARQTTSHLANVRVLDSDAVREFLAKERVKVDCVVLSEVLYYMGPEHAVRSSLGYLASISLPNCRVVMVHGSADAVKLHARATRALSLKNVSDLVIEDSIRSYVISSGNFPFPDSLNNRGLKAAGLRTDLSIRVADQRDSRAMAKLHRRYFPSTLYARMGERFMSSLYRQWMNAEGSFAKVATVNGAFTGFAVGKHSSYAYRRKDLLFSTIVGSAALAVRPHLWSMGARHYLRLLLRRVRGRAQYPGSELTYIAVDGQHRQQGVGSALVSAFELSAQNMHASRCTLVTEETNEVARSFYAHRGWREVALSRTRDGRPLVRLEFSQGKA